MTDFVNNPPHYTAGNIECIEAVKEMLGPEQYKGWLRGSAFKYQWRVELKVDAPEQDIAKAIFYLTRLKEEYENE